ncbi:unnamed protein product [Prorocentrum cordatum]|uniref:Secreted protein n=1 Tax=Prorocentrum cordatum TaxID=2364126 RepID=A0ABN9PLG2_9DINO|nr:unnamed protein product [Polarella glacialis]
MQMQEQFAWAWNNFCLCSLFFLQSELRAPSGTRVGALSSERRVQHMPRTYVSKTGSQCISPAVLFAQLWRRLPERGRGSALGRAPVRPVAARVIRTRPEAAAVAGSFEASSRLCWRGVDGVALLHGARWATGCTTQGDFEYGDRLQN